MTGNRSEEGQSVSCKSDFRERGAMHERTHTQTYTHRESETHRHGTQTFKQRPGRTKIAQQQRKPPPTTTLILKIQREGRMSSVVTSLHSYRFWQLVPDLLSSPTHPNVRSVLKLALIVLVPSRTTLPFGPVHPYSVVLSSLFPSCSYFGRMFLFREKSNLPPNPSQPKIRALCEP